jgi:hypothetical protein
VRARTSGRRMIDCIERLLGVCAPMLVLAIAARNRLGRD